MDKVSLPFKIKNVFEGLAEAHGIVSLEKEALKIEFQTKDSIFGVIKSEVKDVVLPFNEITDINMRKKLFKYTLHIRMSELLTSAKIPNQDSGEIKLFIDKDHVAEATAFISRVKLGIAEQKVKTLSDERFNL